MEEAAARHTRLTVLTVHEVAASAWTGTPLPRGIQYIDDGPAGGARDRQPVAEPQDHLRILHLDRGSRTSQASAVSRGRVSGLTSRPRPWPEPGTAPVPARRAASRPGREMRGQHSQLRLILEPGITGRTGWA